MVNVGDEILGRFQADREPDQAIRNAKLRPGVRLQALVRGRCWMRDQAFGIAEIVGKANDRQRIEKTESRGLGPRELEGHQRRAALAA